MVDLENQRARERSQNGCTRETQVLRTDNVAHPANGGSRGYPLHFRQEVVAFAAAEGIAAAEHRYDVSDRSIIRWRQHIVPYRMTGNRPREVLTGLHQLYMSICYFIWPDATPDQVRVFIYEMSGGERLYSRGAILKRANELKLTRKRASTEAYQAFLPQNIARCWNFWSHPPPVGVDGIRRRQFIDVDEFGIELSRCNSTCGRAHTSIRVRKPGHYSRGTKLTVLLAVEAGDPDVPPHVFGSVEHPRVWYRILYKNGMDQVDFSSFVDEICTILEEHPAPGGCDDHRVFLWDNLATHLTHLVFETVHVRDSPNFFDIVPRPPYQPKFGPSEYAIWDCIQRVRKNVRSDWTLEDLATNVRNVLQNCFGAYGASHDRFIHCGYDFDG